MEMMDSMENDAGGIGSVSRRMWKGRRQCGAVLE